jgi:hypothetical protein
MKWQDFGENCKMRSSITCVLACYKENDQMKKDEMIKGM